MKSRIKLALSLAGSLLAVQSASAATVYYHFDNVTGNVAGTVSGHITGLVDNATSAATGVWVDSYPAGLAGSSGLGSYPVPFDVLTAWSGGTVNENSFTLSGGVVTAAFFSLVGANGDSDQLFLNSACSCTYGTGHTNFLDIGTGDGQYVWNVGNLNSADGLVFGGSSGSVPEPSTWALMLFGFGAIGFAMRKRSNVRTTIRYA
jgi:hypothetical protein